MVNGKVKTVFRMRSGILMALLDFIRDIGTVK